MRDITIQCDRCGKIVNGIIDETCTGGYYDVSKEYWKQFARWEEENICDECMHTDPKYKKMYNVSEEKSK